MFPSMDRVDIANSEYRKYLNLTSWILLSDSNAQSNIVNCHWRIPSQILTTTWSPTARRLLMAAVLYVCCVANGAGICTTWGSTLRLPIHISPPAISANSVPRSSRVITAGKSTWKSIIERANKRLSSLLFFFGLNQKTSPLLLQAWMIEVSCWST